MPGPERAAALNPPGAVAKAGEPPSVGGNGGRRFVMERPKRILTASELFVKKYRTEVAASASSCVSTFVAVSSFFFHFPLQPMLLRREGRWGGRTWWWLGELKYFVLGRSSLSTLSRPVCKRRLPENLRWEPFPTFLTSQLTSSRYKFRSFWDCVSQTHKTEGTRGFWRGRRYPPCFCASQFNLTRQIPPPPRFCSNGCSIVKEVLHRWPQ